MAWSTDLKDWMRGAGFSPETLAPELGTTPRSIRRWLEGASVVRDAARNKLQELGAPVPTRSARPQPGAYARIHGMMLRLEARFDRLEAKLDQLLGQR